MGHLECVRDVHRLQREAVGDGVLDARVHVAGGGLRIGFGRVVVSAIEAPNMFAHLV